MANERQDTTKQGVMARLMSVFTRQYRYFAEGVWTDTRSNWRVDTIRTISLSVKSWLDRGLQIRASALTYQTLLAVVPALALLFAIGRGFGLQETLVEELYKQFPAQRDALEAASVFVDSYLSQSSGGVFVGVGIVFLLWTLISLLSSVEDAFNAIWGVRQGRSFFRKVTDYTAIFLILPVLMICSSGLTLVMSTTLQTLLPFSFMTPLVSTMLDCASLVMTWLFFTGTYMLVPNCKVKFRNAFIAGLIAGTGYVILQWVFVTGQVYVAKYNAIYGSVAFIPLFLIWAQLAWVVCLSGVVVCYSAQNIFQFSFKDQIAKISIAYRYQIAAAVMTVCVHRFAKGEKPLTERDFAAQYGLPARLVTDITSEMIDCGMLARVVIEAGDDNYGLQPTLPPDQITIGYVLSTLREYGNSDFIPGFTRHFGAVAQAVATINASGRQEADSVKLIDLTIDNS